MIGSRSADLLARESSKMRKHKAFHKHVVSMQHAWPEEQAHSVQTVLRWSIQEVGRPRNFGITERITMVASDTCNPNDKVAKRTLVRHAKLRLSTIILACWKLESKALKMVFLPVDA